LLERNKLIARVQSPSVTDLRALDG
jgi:hypothetical protein